MKNLISQYGNVIISVIVGVAMFGILNVVLNTQLSKNIPTTKTVVNEVYKEYVDYTKPIITIKKIDIKLSIGSTFDVMKTPEVTAKDVNGGATTDLTSKVQCFGTVDTGKQGVYNLRYVVENKFGIKQEAKVKVIIE